MMTGNREHFITIPRSALPYPDAVILNTLPFDEALAAYLAYAAT